MNCVIDVRFCPSEPCKSSTTVSKCGGLPNALTRISDVQSASHALLAIYKRNVFPDLKVTWGTYPNNLGHTDYLGCFRCHDDSHATEGKKTISQDCNTCHQSLAEDEASPEILKTFGLAETITSFRKQ